MPELLFLVLQLLIVAIIIFVSLAVLTVVIAAAIVFIGGTDTSPEDLDYDFET